MVLVLSWKFHAKNMVRTRASRAPNIYARKYHSMITHENIVPDGPCTIINIGAVEVPRDYLSYAWAARISLAHGRSEC